MTYATFDTAGTFTPEQVIAGDFPIVTEVVTIKQGQVLPAFAVLGEIAAERKYILGLAAANDGSQNLSAILQVPVDATANDVRAPVWLTGTFAGEKLVFGAGYDKVSAKSLLRRVGIFLKSLAF
jgi:hypothetical protein